MSIWDQPAERPRPGTTPNLAMRLIALGWRYLGRAGCACGDPEAGLWTDGKRELCSACIGKEITTP